MGSGRVQGCHVCGPYLPPATDSHLQTGLILICQLRTILIWMGGYPLGTGRLGAWGSGPTVQCEPNSKSGVDERSGYMTKVLTKGTKVYPEQSKTHTDEAYERLQGVPRKEHPYPLKNEKALQGRTGRRGFTGAYRDG